MLTDIVEGFVRDGGRGGVEGALSGVGRFGGLLGVAREVLNRGEGEGVAEAVVRGLMPEGAMGIVPRIVGAAVGRESEDEARRGAAELLGEDDVDGVLERLSSRLDGVDSGGGVGSGGAGLGESFGQAFGRGNDYLGGGGNDEMQSALMRALEGVRD